MTDYRVKTSASGAPVEALERTALRAARSIRGPRRSAARHLLFEILAMPGLPVVERLPRALHQAGHEG